MTYLTRFPINTARRGAAKLLASPHALHAAVESSFPPGDETHTVPSTARILWRLDRGARDAATLYLQSPRRPDLTHLVEQAGWPRLDGGWETHSLQPLIDYLSTGQRWRFRLTANPTTTLTPAAGKRGKVIPLVKLQQQEEWLAEKGKQMGVRFERPMPEDNVSTSFVMSKSRQTQFDRRGRSVSLTIAQFDGALLVEDPDRLRNALVGGIGRAKGYGCGLLTLSAPITPMARSGTD